MKDNSLLQRYEFKYFLEEKTSYKIIENVKKFMRLDEFASEKKEQSYFVRSVYFENDLNNNFIEKVDGQKTRKKFRVRTYDKNFNNSPVYLEIKGRNLERTFKKRTKLDQNDIENIMNKKDYFYLLKKYPNNILIQEFIFEVLRKNLKPKIVVDYFRTPFINNYGLYFRLTFDKSLNCVNLDNKFKNLHKNQNFLCKAGYTILEVKFERSIPSWFHRLIQSYELHRVSISKFVLGMCSLNIASETSD